jgi:hypothetical protein
MALVAFSKLKAEREYLYKNAFQTFYTIIPTPFSRPIGLYRRETWRGASFFSIFSYYVLPFRLIGARRA